MAPITSHRIVASGRRVVKKAAITAMAMQSKFLVRFVMPLFYQIHYHVVKAVIVKANRRAPFPSSGVS